MANVKNYVEGETYPRGVVVKDLEKMLFSIAHVTKVKDGKVWLEHDVDLSEMAIEDVYKHAVADIVIKYRGRSFKQWKIAECADKMNNGFVFRTSDYPKSESGLSPVQRAKSGISGLAKQSKTRKDYIANLMIAMPGLTRKTYEEIASANAPELK